MFISELSHIRTSKASEEEWDRISEEDSSATIFQTSAWYKLATLQEGIQPYPMRIDLGEIKAILPLQIRSRMWGSLLGSPFGTYTALLCASKLTEDHLKLISKELEGFNLDLFGSPFTRNPISLKENVARQTRVIRLLTLDPKKWVSSWSRNHKRCLRMAQETGFQIRVCETESDLENYYQIYKTLIDRWGTTARRAYPQSLFMDAYRLLTPKNALRLWIAEQNGKPVAGRLCLYHGQHAVEWHAAAERTAMDQGVNHLLVHNAVLHAKQAGFQVYDFNPNPGLHAVDHFKRGFQSEVLPFHGANNRVGLGAIAGYLRQAKVFEGKT